MHLASQPHAPRRAQTPDRYMSNRSGDNIAHTGDRKSRDGSSGWRAAGSLTMREPRRRERPWVLWVITSIAAALYLILGHAHSLPVILFLAVLYPLVPEIFPAAQPAWGNVLAPHNWAMCWFFVVMFVEPLNVALLDAKPLIAGVLRASDFSINAVLLLVGLAYLGYCCGYHGASRRHRTAPCEASRWVYGASASRSILLVPLFAALGVTGIYLHYGGFSGFFSFLADPSGRFVVTERLPGTWAGGLGTVFRPFLPFAVAIVWCYVIDTYRGARRTGTVALLSVLAACFVVLASGHYNRGSMVVPVVAMLAVFSGRVRRLPTLALVPIGTILLMVSIYWGTYRSGELKFSQAATEVGLAQMHKGTDLKSNFANILVSATALERYGLLSKVYLGKTLLCSALFPLPILGKPFRDQAGPTLYNELIYSGLSPADQPIPFYFELFINYHFCGVLVGYFFLGTVTAHLNWHFAQGVGPSAIRGYALFFPGFWCAALVAGSLAVVSQMCIFMFWPIYTVLWWTSVRKVPRHSATTLSRFHVTRPFENGRPHEMVSPSRRG